MGDVAKDLGHRSGIEWRGIGGDPQDGQVAGVEGRLQAPDTAPDVFVGRVVVEAFLDEPCEPAVSDHRPSTEGPIVEFVGSEVPGEVSEGPRAVVLRQPLGRFFSHGPPPNFAGWRRGRRPGGHATGATRRPDMATHPPRLSVRRRSRLGACHGSREGPSQTYWRCNNGRSGNSDAEHR